MDFSPDSRDRAKLKALPIWPIAGLWKAHVRPILDYITSNAFALEHRVFYGGFINAGRCLQGNPREYFYWEFNQRRCTLGAKFQRLFLGLNCLETCASKSVEYRTLSDSLYCFTRTLSVIEIDATIKVIAVSFSVFFCCANEIGEVTFWLEADKLYSNILRKFLISFDKWFKVYGIIENKKIHGL